MTVAAVLAAGWLLLLMGAGRGVQGGALAPPWNLNMMTSYAVFMQNTPKIFARASGARIKYP